MQNYLFSKKEGTLMINIISRNCAVKSEVSKRGWGLHLGGKDLTETMCSACRNRQFYSSPEYPFQKISMLRKKCYTSILSESYVFVMII